jgi:hypothetical protein
VKTRRQELLTDGLDRVGDALADQHLVVPEGQGQPSSQECAELPK